MKDLTREETLEVLTACLDLLANREAEIRALYDKLQRYEPELIADGKIIGPISPDVKDHERELPCGWPSAVAVCGTPLIGRSLMLLCPQVGLRIVGITDSGLDGLKLAEKHRPSYAFIDLDVADIDGLVLVSRLKEILPGITIVALSGAAQESALVSAIIAGASEVIGKPIQAKRVMNVVGRLVRNRATGKKSAQTIPVHFNPVETKDQESWRVL